jgi:hypothetical protein
MSGPNDLEHLWTTDAALYVLFDLGSDRFVIVERRTRSALVIEDDAIMGQVVSRMLDAGVPVVDTWPNDLK